MDRLPLIRPLSTHRRFIVLLALFVAGVLAQGLALPAMEGSDESIHSTYTELMRRGFQLPDRATFRTNATRQESGQPPLTYWLAAQGANALQLPSRDPDALLAHLNSIRNSWLTPPDAWNRRDNLNHYLHGPNEIAFGAPDVVTTDRALRLTSLIYGILAVIGAYGVSREVFRRVVHHEAWALTATAIFAFMPTLIHINAYLTNDAPSVAFATLAVWTALRILRLGASPIRCLMLGVLLALGALSKVNVLLVAPGVGLALLWDLYNRRYTFIRFLSYGLLTGLPLVVLFGPWVAWGIINYGDPFGFMTHFNPTLSYDQRLTVPQLLPLMPEIYLSYWAKFGLAKIYLNPVTYTAMGVLLAFSLLGYLVSALHPRRSISFLHTLLHALLHSLHVQQALVLGVVFLVVFAGLIRWMQEIAIITGRLMYPAHIAIAIGLTGGLYGLARAFPRLTRPLQLGATGLMAVAGIILSPVAIAQTYAPPRMLTPDQLPALQGGPVDYDGTIRLLGFTQETPVLSGSTHTVTLCWEVLKAAERPAAFSVKLVRDGVIVADRTSTHGLGSYPSPAWQPGDIWCDEVEMPFDDPDVQDDPLPQPGTVYDILVVLLDARTREVDWQPTLPDGREIQFPFVGQVISPAGDQSGEIAEPLTSTAIVFPGFARLEGYAVDGALEPGATVTLNLLWQVTNATPDDWIEFVHLIGPNGVLAHSLVDTRPRAGAYPTWAWSAGERVTDSIPLPLPDDLPPGEYALALGFYRSDTGERMPVSVYGEEQINRQATLLTFTIEGNS